MKLVGVSNSEPSPGTGGVHPGPVVMLPSPRQPLLQVGGWRLGAASVDASRFSGRRDTETVFNAPRQGDG